MKVDDSDMAQAVSRQLLLRKHGFDPRAFHVNFVVDTLTLGPVL
jgi:hypothetical protein